MSMAQQFTQIREKARRPPADVYAEETGEYPALRAATAAVPAGAPIVVLTADAELGKTVGKMAAGEHVVAIAADLDAASELAAAGRCAILITDQALTQAAFARITARLRPHDPAVVTIAVGSRGQDNVLLALMSSAAIDRFMLKPLTAGLAKIVIDSAGREYAARTSQRHVRPAAADAMPRARAVPAAPASAQEASVPEAAVKKERFRGNNEVTQEVRVEPASAAVPQVAVALDAPRPPANPARPSWVAFVAALAGVGALVWWVMVQRMPDIDPRQVIASNLSAAHAAVTGGHYIEPAEQSALHYFSTVLALDPANGAAKQGIDRIADHFASTSRALIEQGRFAEAVSALQSVRRVRPGHVQLAPLEAELRSRLERQFPQARAAATVETPQAVAAEVAKAAPRKTGVASIAATAKPETATPQVSAQQSSDAMQGRMLADAKQAIESGQLGTASQLIAAARQVGVTQSDLGMLDQSLAAAEQKRVVEDSQRLALQRPVESKPRETAPATAAVPTLQATPTPVLAATSPAPAPTGAASKLVKVVQPDYPGEARLRGIEGWVDLSFVVSQSGDVLEPRVEDSNMKHLFARPALSAVRQWKYAPRAAAGPDSQRTLVRVQFKLNAR